MHRSLLLISFLLLFPSLLPAQDATKAGAVISYAEAHEMTQGFTRTLEGTQSFLYSKRPFLELLAQPGIEGLRFWYGRQDGRPVLVAVGTDAQGQDKGDLFVDDGERCPPHCPSTLAPVQDVSKAGALISPEEADELTGGFAIVYQGVRSHLYSADLFQRLLAQKGAEGLRVYPSWKDGKPQLVFLATDDRGVDLRLMIIDNGHKCPPYCP